MKKKPQTPVAKLIPDQLSNAKGAFNVAVLTQRPELVKMIKEPMTLSPEEAQALANDLIGLKQDVAEWKDKWQRRKELMADAHTDVKRATENLKAALANLNVTDPMSE